MDKHRKPRVLVVVDEENITELVSMGLTFNGFETERVATARAASDSIHTVRGVGYTLRLKPGS